VVDPVVDPVVETVETIETVSSTTPAGEPARLTHTAHS
jgi:hypothetical protein